MDEQNPAWRSKSKKDRISEIIVVALTQIRSFSSRTIQSQLASYGSDSKDKIKNKKIRVVNVALLVLL
jgi:hypothetical protein